MLRLLERCLVALGEVARHFFTAFCVRFLVSLSKVLAIVGVRLKFEVFWSSRLLRKAPRFKVKVRVRLKLEGGLI